MANFDEIAAQFELHRSFPPTVLRQVQQAVFEVLPAHEAKLLEIGAGTGRFGRSFIGWPGLTYFAIDRSFEMLRQFAAHTPDSNLVQADACSVPFSNNAFAGV